MNTMVYLKSVYFIYICAFILSYLGCKSDKIEDKLIVSPLSAIQYKSLDVKPSVIYRSEDLGNTWVSYANGIPTDATLSSIKQQGQKVYVATDYHGIFVDTHCQNEWKPILISNFKSVHLIFNKSLID